MHIIGSYEWGRKWERIYSLPSKYHTCGCHIFSFTREKLRKEKITKAGQGQ